MSSPSRIRLALLLACALLSGTAAPAQTVSRGPARQPPPARQVNLLPSVERRRWDTSHNWVDFTTGALGDAGVTDSMTALLASGLNPDTRDRFGRTALHAAALLAQSDLARYLLSRGAAINSTDSEGRTPLMLSASLGGMNFFGPATTSPWEMPWAEPVCDLDPPEPSAGMVRGLDDWHAMVAAQSPMLRLLLDAGADPNLKDSRGWDALDHAALAGPTGLDRQLVGKAGVGESSRCDLDLARSPEVRGLRLGMTLREAVARFHPSEVPGAQWCGRQTLEFDFSADFLGQPTAVPRGMEGVRRLRLSFLDGRLAYFRVTYYREAAPLKPDEFRGRLSESLHLPSRWRKAGAEQLWDQPYSIGCDGFAVMAGYFQGPYVELHDTTALDRLLDRRAEERLKRRREAESERERRGRIFKP
jgi:hypothetical protein